jgi:hypothetical protein
VRATLSDPCGPTRRDLFDGPNGHNGRGLTGKGLILAEVVVGGHVGRPMLRLDTGLSFRVQIAAFPIHPEVFSLFGLRL